MAYTFSLTDTPSAEDFQAVENGLTNFNLKYVPADGYRPLAVFVRDDGNQTVGGLMGNTYWGWLYIGSLWLAENECIAPAGTSNWQQLSNGNPWAISKFSRT